MNLWRGLQDSISSLFSNSVTFSDSNGSTVNPSSLVTPNSSSNCNSLSSSSAKMEVGIDGGVVANERTAAKLKGYFDLAMGQADKAMTAEDSGLFNDAILHYRNAQRILAEGAATYVPSFISESEQKKVNFYLEKISFWQGNVSERLQKLGARTGVITNREIATSPLKGNKDFSKTKNAAQAVQQRRPTVAKSNFIAGNRPERAAASRSSQASSSGDAKLVEMIDTVIVDRSPSVRWDDVGGLDKAKSALKEMVILPTQRRDVFTGLRRPARGLLLFGPPGNGKTMLAKAVASECNATFFNVSASTLTSKWVGEAEKLVRTLFMVAISRQPSIIFMDEIDSLMSTREANEHDASRRLKSEFLVQFDGVNSNPDDLVIVIGATNKPQEIDDAVLRRLVKRIYIPLPDENVRRLLLNQKLKGRAFSLPRRDLERLVRETEGYSGSDLQALCEAAAMIPIRELGSNLLTVDANEIRGLRYEDFQKAMLEVRPSLRRSRWEELERWNQEFGSN